MSLRCILLSLIVLATLWLSNGHSVPSQDPYFKIVSSGLTSILWSQDDKFMRDIAKLSPKCSSALEYIYNGIHRDGLEKAYELLDSSSKTPAGILDGTTASFGDYDGCLSLQLDGQHGSGQYCTVTMALKDPGNSSAIGSLYYQALPYLGAFDLSYGLCLPAACTRDEVETFVLARTNNYPLELSTYKDYPLDFDTPLTCETRDETTWLYRIENLNKTQIFSIIWLLILPTITSIATFVTLIGVRGRINDFSIQNTIKKLITYEEPTDASVFLMESAKASVVIGGCYGHLILPTEKLQPIQYLVTPNVYTPFTGNWIAQPWNDGLLGAIPFVAGYACYKFYASKIASGSFNYAKTIVNRYLRMIIAVSVATAVEFIFPLLGDGPIYKIVTQRFARDCYTNWWRHFVVDVHTPRQRSCAIYMFLGGIDLELLLIGLLVLWMFKRFNVRTTFIISILITFASCLLMHEQVKHLNLPTFISNPADLKLISESFFATHFILSYYLPGFMIGLLTAYIAENRILLYQPVLWKFLLHLTFLNIWCLIGLFAPALHTILKVVPRSAYGLFIVCHRMMYFIAFSLFGLLVSHSNGILSLAKLPRPFKALLIYSARMAPAIHLTNSLLARYHFLTMRQLASIRPYDVISRFVFGGYFILVISIAVHINIVGPMMALVPRSKSSADKKQDKKD